MEFTFDRPEDETEYLRKKTPEKVHEQLGLGTTTTVKWSPSDKESLKEVTPEHLWEMLGLEGSAYGQQKTDDENDRKMTPSERQEFKNKQKKQKGCLMRPQQLFPGSYVDLTGEDETNTMIDKMVEEALQPVLQLLEASLEAKLQDEAAKNARKREEAEKNINKQQREIERLLRVEKNFKTKSDELIEELKNQEKKLGELSQEEASLVKDLEKAKADGNKEDGQRLKQQLNFLGRRSKNYTDAIEQKKKLIAQRQQQLKDCRRQLKEAKTIVRRHENFGMSQIAIAQGFMVKGKVATRMRIFQAPSEGKGFHEWRLISRLNEDTNEDVMFYIDPTRTIAIEGDENAKAEENAKAVIDVMQQYNIKATEAVVYLETQGKSIPYTKVTNEWLFCEDLEYDYDDEDENDDDKDENDDDKDNNNEATDG